MKRHRSRADVILRTFVAALAGLALALSVQLDRSTACAEEPYRQFLEKLNTSGYHDLALVYLNDLEKGGNADPEFVKEIPLERAILLQAAAAKMSPRSPGRTKRLDEAEKVLQSFLDANKEHARRGEARLGLGSLLLARAEEAKGDSDGKTDVPDAIKYFGEAEKVFTSTQAELKTLLEKVQGARIDPADEAGKAMRERLRSDYRRAELLAAFSTENKGRSHAKGSDPWKKALDEAQKAYSAFYGHEKDRQEARNIALFYRSGIQRDFGMANDAADGFNRIVGLENIDELRPLQFKSLTELIKLWGTKEQDKFSAVLELINKWEKQIRPDERSSQDVIDFQLAAARAKIEFAQLLQSKNADDRNIPKLRKDVREDLLRIIKINGPHQIAAREMLAQFGLGKERSSEVVEVPKVKNFEEAVKEASSRFENMQTELVTQQTLQDSLAKETDEAKKKEIADQLGGVNDTINRLQDQASELYGTGLRMFPKGGEMGALNDARYRLAYLQLQRGKPRSAIAIGEFLAHVLAGDPTGLQAATVALAGYGKLISDADLASQGSIANQLQPFAEFMVTTWPESTQAQAAASTLVQLAMNAGDIAKAREYIDKLPGGSGKSGTLKRDLGARLAAEFFQEKLKLTEGAEVPAALVTKRDAAIEVLQAGLKGITQKDIDSRAMDAINSLVRLYLSVGKIDEALEWINNKELAPVVILRSKLVNVDQNLTKLDSYRTALQASISMLSSAAGQKPETADAILKEIDKLVGELREAAGSDSEGSKRLTSIFVSVAKEIQDMIDTAKTPQIKQKLADGLVLLCQQVAASSDEFNTRFWAGRELSNVAMKLDASSAKTKQTLVQESAKLLEGILTKEAEKPGWIDIPNGALSVRVFLAQSMRQAGQYQQAMDQLTKVLGEKEAALPLQIAAAETYQAWGDSGAAEHYEQALNGALNNASGGRLIWGWKGISSQLQNKMARDPKAKAELKEPFIEARYNVSMVLYRHALADAGQKDELLGKAFREIGSTRFLMPDMGGPENFKKFDALMKNIQKAQGKELTGLAPAAKPKLTEASQ